MYTLNCIDCGYTWQSESADCYECPVCGLKDVVVVS